MPKIKQKEDLCIQVLFANTFFSRLRGLMWKEKKDAYSIVFPICKSVHTFGMKFNIDVVFICAKTYKVLEIYKNIRPRKIVKYSKNNASQVNTLEIPSHFNIPINKGCVVTLLNKNEGANKNRNAIGNT